MEIERKWLVGRLPSLKPQEHYLIEQTYIIITDNEEVRVTRRTDQKTFETVSHKLTIKSGTGLVRQEIEINITPEQYAAFVEGRRRPILKDYYIYDNPTPGTGIGRLEVSTVDKGTEDSFKYAEVEYDSEEVAQLTGLPTYLVEEMSAIDVTGIPEFSMKNYWLKTRGRP